MKTNQVLSEFFIEVGIACTKAGKRLADISENGEVVTTDLPSEKKEEPKKTTKKATTKKASTKKAAPKKEEPKEESKEKAFVAKNPPKGKTEVGEFRKHWAELSAEQQDAYVAGEIDSLGNSLKTATKAKEAPEELDDFGDEGSSATADDVRKALQAYSKNHKDGVEAGKKEAKGILAAFGAMKVADLSEDQYEDVIQELS